MDTVTLLVLLVVLLTFSGLLFWSIANSRKQGQLKAQMAQTLGPTPIEPDETLLAQISALYQTPGNKPRHSLHNLMRRRLPDGELFLFDLVDRDIESDSWLERQAVAIALTRCACRLSCFFPKSTWKSTPWAGWQTRLFNGAPLKWERRSVSRNSRLSRRVTTSLPPTPKPRAAFLMKARYFAKTAYFGLRAGGNLFTFAEIEPGLKISDPAQITRRINRALEIYRLFQGG